MPQPSPTGLPVEAVVPDVRAALAAPGTRAVLQAPPGAGKTTVVPLRLLDDVAGRILVLEPRRVAARAAAARMAALLGEPVGATVGWTTRDERVVSRDTRIEVVTEGILTRRLQHDRALPGVGLVIFDEVHERNLHTDLALAFALDAGDGARPDLRLLAMSATLDPAPLASLLGGAPVVASEGWQHPVDVRWAPPKPTLRPADAVAAAVGRAVREHEGDVLVFLAGAGDIRRVERLLAGEVPGDVDVRPLFGALPVAEQDLALAPSPPGRRRIVLATDIAESSLTVAGVRTVVDSGQSRTPRYDPRTGLTALVTGPISKASADQRAGRAGRTAPGTAYRLWSKLEHAARRPFAPPEIASVDLSGLVLEVAVWGKDAADLRFLDPPPARALDEARALLADLGALDAGGRPTAEGLAMAELPLHPRLARMVTGQPGWAACVLAAVLEERDLFRGRPDEVPVDVAERVRLIGDGIGDGIGRGASAARHPLADGPAIAAARRRATQLARRIGVRPEGSVSELGPVLALAYPDRVAQARGGARFRLRNGTGAWVPKADPLAGEAFLVVAELDADRRDSRIRMAASLDPADVVDATGAEPTVESALAYDERTGGVRSSETWRVGGIVLADLDRPAAGGAATTAALLDHAVSTGLAALPWTDAARSVQHRSAFLRRTFGDGWPDLSDAALTATAGEWLAPLLEGATKLDRVDVAIALRRQLAAAGRAGDLDRLAPPTLTTRAGRTVAIDYSGERPAASIRVQDLYGTTRHPTVADGRVPVTLHLLSPAGRPVQVTADLPGFWSGSWAAVRKDMAGRYPKHPWPEDPASAAPPDPNRSRAQRRKPGKRR